MNTFRILAQFLKRSDDEVEGRELPEPPEDRVDKLRHLARGSLPEAQQAELFSELNRRPDWVAWLAGEIKSMRGSAG